MLRMIKIFIFIFIFIFIWIFFFFFSIKTVEGQLELELELELNVVKAHLQMKYKLPMNGKYYELTTRDLKANQKGSRDKKKFVVPRRKLVVLPVHGKLVFHLQMGLHNIELRPESIWFIPRSQNLDEGQN